MPKNNDLVFVDEKYLENKIYIIRRQKVMLDSDLAKIYGYSLSAFNQQVKNNKHKFDSDFMFQITKEEYINLKSKNLISSWGGVRKLPFVFTEQGLYMLMTVLKGPLATEQSKALIRAFKLLKDTYMENKSFLQNNTLDLRTQLLEKDVKEIKDDNRIIKMDLKKVMDNFIDPSTYKHFLILDGMKLEADIAYRNIFKQAKKSIIYIDNYIGLKTLELLSYARNNVSIIIFSDNKANPPLTESILNDFNIQNKTNRLVLFKPSLHFHDRYIIIDHNTKNVTIYHCGASLKDAGNKITTIQKIEDPSIYNKIITELLKKII